MRKEEWQKIPLNVMKGNYEVSTIGNVRSIDRVVVCRNSMKRKYKSRLLTLLPKKGYYNVKIYKKLWPVHRLVAKTFIPNAANKAEVNHLSGVKTDNRIENLEWATKEENYRHAIATGLIDNKGEKNHFHKLTDKQVIEIRIKATMYKDRELSLQYKVHPITISRIKNNKKWKHLPAMGEKIIGRRK